MSMLFQFVTVLTYSSPSQLRGLWEEVGQHGGFGGRLTVGKEWHGSHSVDKSFQT